MRLRRPNVARASRPATGACVTVALALAAGAGCKRAKPESGGPPIVNASPSSRAPGAAIPSPSELAGLSLLVGRRLPELRDKAARGLASWQRLKAHADELVREPDASGMGAENLALAYLVEADVEHARAAYAAARALMQRDVRSDSYLRYGDYMRGVAMVLDHCGAALSADEQGELASYLDRTTNELWFDNRGNGWGLKDPGSNYHLAFLEGTAFAGYALQRRAHPNAGRYLERFFSLLEGHGGVLAYLEARGEGGDWPEGVNYGQRSKQRLFSALSLVASMGGPNYFARHRFFRDAVSYAVYQVQPDRRALFPGGDLSRDSAMLICPYDRDYVETAAYFLDDAATRQLARYYLSRVVKSYEDGFRWREGLYKGVLFETDGAVANVAALPRSYLASGTGWLNIRSGWEHHATSLSISGGALHDQDHAHADVGSFVLWKGGWQAVDASSFSKGINWEAGAHNMVSVVGHQRRHATMPGMVRFSHADGVAHASVDATGLFVRRGERHDETLLGEWTREIVYLEPDTVVVYDRVSPKDGVRYDVRLHFAGRPERGEDGSFSGRFQEGGIAHRWLSKGEVVARPDDDLDGGPSSAWRAVQLPPDPASDGRFLSVTRVAWQSVPDLRAHELEASGDVEGVRVEDTVVLFGRASHGAPIERASVRVPNGAVRRILVCNGGGPYDVRAEPDGGAVRVSLALRGPTTEAGLISVSLPR